ncbi:MAG: histidinol-phosphatase HisJ family protein [Candidatus Cloacimonadaceae bacterium]|jgi:histidinol-phosphatase (PHP family)|nr:histidinol-phosphatase HisJ family protein [Candidatus Cloacimonadota bacterium]MDY0126850.1 histidinol-phosphatase HisJ family protein [Candidatus Cloacimonadaceae bacterium]MCB5255092.1 histidinol-phosphatase HisJ family protein [Candidatus Cloacimonadota bacterium]MCK9177625.1 histidinol-phosphatase HisJ family protein [Candidatus Cloacimonadota bacterium]MCK9242487.1 histidinol-phosphatase HisJ family protein [Candidatus Cloacimonadota bacterium]
MKYDFHLHTQFSFDSRMTGEELLQKAVKLEYDEIAITEHLDLLPQELSIHGLPSLSKYQTYIRALQEKYPEVKLHKGIEIGDYHQVQYFAQNLISGFDFFPILGSVHFVSEHLNVAIPLKKPLSQKEVKDYYLHNLKLVSTCEIDILAHLGVYKRYYESAPDESFALSIIKDIFQVMIERGIALEINLSSLRKPYQEVITEPHYLQIYQDMGGSLFSLGSDAHVLDAFGEAHIIAKKLGIESIAPRHRRQLYS